MLEEQWEESLTELVRQTPLEFHIHPVPISEIPEEQRFEQRQKAWFFSFALEGRTMQGYYAGGDLAGEPSAEDIIQNLLLTCYSTREANRITDNRLGYARSLQEVLGQERLEHFLTADWDV